MKRTLYVAAAGLLLLAPWALHRLTAAQPSICSGESELFARSSRGAIHYHGSMTYSPKRQGRALMRFVGDFDVGDGRHYHVNRTAEVRSEVVDGEARLVTLSASRSFADDAPDDLVRRYVHPALEAGAQYDVKLFDLAAGTLASGSELSPRNVCLIRAADA